MIKRTITKTFEVTPEELAFEFCNMNDSEHALFFNEIAKITKQWERPFCFQLQYISDNKLLTDEGRSIMSAIGDYGNSHNC